MGLLQVEDVVRLVVVTLGCFLIYASYKKCDKDNKKLKVIVSSYSYKFIKSFKL